MAKREDIEDVIRMAVRVSERYLKEGVVLNWSVTFDPPVAPPSSPKIGAAPPKVKARLDRVDTKAIKARGRRTGTAVVWPSGVEERYGISAPTRWRWEKNGRLPKRDVNLGGRTGWRPQTLDDAEASSTSEKKA